MQPAKGNAKVQDVLDLVMTVDHPRIISHPFEVRENAEAAVLA